MDGVLVTRVGYTGGRKSAPSYEEVCTGRTGHAEAVEVTWFFANHDPTTRDRQGPDIGSQYRSAIFYVDEEQRSEAETAKDLAQKRLGRTVVTEIVAAGDFFPAEEYHQHWVAKKRGEKLPSCVL